jgi:glyoxylase-like metal-dependent hydrolase (beta-lactamase superfamily II)
MKLVGLFAALATISMSANQDASAAETAAGEATIHLQSGGAYSNSIMIETSEHLIVIDPGTTQADAQRILARSQETGKQIHSVLITHAHIDHYGAMGAIRSAGARFLASPGVARHLREYNAINYARFGAAPPASFRGPDALLRDTESFTVDGVTITLHEMGPGEAYADSWFLIESNSGNTAIIGDLAMYGIPPFMQSAHSSDWLNSLEQLKREIPEGAAIVIGHDRRAAETGQAFWGRSILDWQIARIREFRQTVFAITGAERLLTDDEIAGVVEALQRAAPENSANYSFLITTSANVLAAELILEAQKAALETNLQTLLRARLQQRTQQ